MGGGVIYPLQNLTRGDGLCNIPPLWWKVNKILTYLYKYSVKINRFCSKNSWFLMILAKFYQKFLLKSKTLVSPRNYFFYSSPALNLRLKVFTKLHDSSGKNTKFSSFWGGTSPSDISLCAQACNWRWRATKSSPPMSKTDLCPWGNWSIFHWMGSPSPPAKNNDQKMAYLFLEGGQIIPWVFLWT